MSTSSTILGCLILAAAIAGYLLGHGRAEAEGRAVLNQLRVERAEEQRQRAEAYGKAVAEALDKYRDERARGEALAAQLMTTTSRHATEADALRRKLTHATRNSTYVFGADVIRLLNEAAGVFDLPVSASLHTICPDGRPGSCGAAGARLRDPFAGVTEADFAEWFVTFGKGCRDNTARLRNWQDLARRNGWTPADTTLRGTNEQR